MKPNEMRQLSREELLEMLLEQSRENTRLSKQIEQLEQKLADRDLHISKAGSIAEAALALNGIFEAAEASCRQYEENVQMLYERHARLSEEMGRKSREKAEALLQETQQQCDQLRADTQRDCAEKLAQTEQQVEAKWNSLSGRLQALYDSHQGLLELAQMLQTIPLEPKRGLTHAETAEETDRTAHGE